LEVLLRRLSASDRGDLVHQGTLHTQVVTAARRLVSRIADESNLILDPDLDSYYTMSVVVLRLPELVATAVELSDSAAAVRRGPADDSARMTFLLEEGAFTATANATMSDAAAAYRGNPSGDLQRNLEMPLGNAQKAVIDYSAALRDIVVAPQTTDANPFPHRLLQRFTAATGESWRKAAIAL